MELTASYQRFLKDLIDNDGERELREGAESIPGIKALLAGGYIRLSPALCGPLGVRTCTFFAQITDAGRAAFNATLPPDLAQSAKP